MSGAFACAGMVRMLQLIKTFVGNADQLIGLVAILRKIGDSMIHGDGEGKLQRTQDFREHRLDAATKSEGLRGISLRQQQGEFISTDAKSGIRRAQGILQGDGRGTKNLVATGMTIAIVDFLEAVEIEKHDTQRQAVTARAIEFFFEGLREEPAIVKAGQRIGDRVYLQLLELVVFEHYRNP